MDQENRVQPDPVIHETHEQMPRRWPLLVLYVAMAFVVALLVVFGGRAIYRHNHHPVVKTPPTTVKRPPATPPATPPKSDTNTASNSSTSLPNSGPGQVVSLFVVSTTAAGGLHYLINFRRSAKNY